MPEGFKYTPNDAYKGDLDKSVLNPEFQDELKEIEYVVDHPSEVSLGEKIDGELDVQESAEYKENLIRKLVAEGNLPEDYARLLPLDKLTKLDIFQMKGLKKPSPERVSGLMGADLKMFHDHEKKFPKEWVSFYEAIEVARSKGESSEECDKLTQELLLSRRFPGTVNENYPPLMPAKDTFQGKTTKLPFSSSELEEIRTMREELVQKADFSIESIKNAIDFSKKYLKFRLTPNSLYDVEKALERDINPYSEGVPVREIIGQEDEIQIFGGIVTRDGHSENYQFVLKEFLQSLFKSGETISDEEKERITNEALPIINTKNLLFHRTDVERIPLIARTGLLSPKWVDNLFKKRFNSRTVFWSGWGSSYLGPGYVDVWDPTNTLDDVPKQYEFTGPSTKDLRMRQEPGENQLNYDISEDYDLTKQGLSNTTRSMMKQIGAPSFVIKLKPERSDQLIRYDRAEKDASGKVIQRNVTNWSLVKDRVRPEEIVGLILYTGQLAELNSFLPGKEKETLTTNQMLEILGSNIKMPIYDSSGNLLWPKIIEKDELLKRKIAGQKFENKSSI